MKCWKSLPCLNHQKSSWIPLFFRYEAVEAVWSNENEIVWLGLNFRYSGFQIPLFFFIWVSSNHEKLSVWNVSNRVQCPCTIEWCVKNLTQLWIWPFYGHFSHFFTSYINIFYITKVQTVILRCLTSLNLNWIKSYYMNHKRLCFSILEEKKLKI